MDIQTITLITVSIIGSLGSLLSILHLKKCHSGCVDSECFKGNTPTTTPLLKPIAPIDHPPYHSLPQ